MGFLVKDIDFEPAQEANLGPEVDYTAGIRGAYQAALTDPRRANETAAAQTSLAQALQAQAEGRGPSLAQKQLAQALGQVQQQAASAVASQRGLSPALARSLVLGQQARAAQDAANQSGALRLQEQNAARALLAQALQAQRAQDIGQQQANTALMGTASQAYLGQRNQQLQNYWNAQNLNAQVAAADAAAHNAWIPALIGGASSGAGAALAGAALARGGVIPGRPRVSGDHPANDTVPAMLSPGEIVVPRSIAQAPDAPDRTREFVAAIKQQQAKERGPKGYARVLAAQRALAARVAALEGERGFSDGGYVSPIPDSMLSTRPPTMRALQAADARRAGGAR